jgi:hypothetical protein
MHTLARPVHWLTRSGVSAQQQLLPAGLLRAEATY